MLAYAAAHTAHAVLSAFYDAGPIWSVFNVISAVSILIALAANFHHWRVTPGRRSGPIVLLYANALLAIWFFWNWFRLLALEAGETVSVHSEVLWMLILGMIPLVLATTGWRLFRD